jgi:serine/threonine-protein kinase
MEIDKIGKYSIVGVLGKGAMGIVYKGVDPLIGRTVAIKTIRFDVMGSSFEQEEAIKRFNREAQSAGILSHPNIVTIYDVGEAEGLTYIAMEYIDGRSLEELIVSRKKFPLDEIINFMTQIGDALDYAHMKGIVHRDIKPGNILIDKEGNTHLCDFGIARIATSTLTQTGTSLGTPNYMSPEQIKGKKVDNRSDIFSVGVILYELLTNEKPFPGDSFTTVLYKIMNEDPLPLKAFDKKLPDGLDHIVIKALAKAPESRYQSCRELTEDLINYPKYATMPLPERRETEGETTKAKVFPEFQKEKKKKPLLILVASMMTLVVAVIAFVFLYMNRSTRSDSSGDFASLPPPTTETQIQAPAEKEKKERKSEIKPAETISTEKGESRSDPSKIEKKVVDLAANLDLGMKAFNQGDFDQCIKQMKEILKFEPKNTTAKEYLNLASLKIAPKQMKSIVNQYVQSIKEKSLPAFYKKACSPELYQEKKEEAELIFHLYRNIKIAVSNISIQFRDISQAEVNFSRILTGISRSDGTKQVLSEGIVKWEMRKQGDSWKIVDISYSY